MRRNPIVLIHGYSDDGGAFDKWQGLLEQHGYDVAMLHACTYRSLANEVSIKDIAEGFDRALKLQAGLSEDEPFDAIVHSTGMLVIRAWLTAYDDRRQRLKHLIGLAPATFGSPLAHKGRSWLGALFKGNRHLGPDFMEAGDKVLDGLELASRFTWDLSHLDLLGEETFYGPTRRTPYVFIFSGNQSYGGLRRLVDNEPGSDGVVRWAACPLNTRKIMLDLTQAPALERSEQRISVAEWRNTDIPLIHIEGKNHGTILSDPGDALIELVDGALQVSSAAAFTEWIDDALERSRPARAKVDEWQQFVIRVVDERGDPVPDYNIQLFRRGTSASDSGIHQFDVDVHTYKGDSSLRCFHVRLSDLDYKRLPNLWVRVIATSGSQLVGYQGFGSEKSSVQTTTSDGKWDASLNISSLVDDTGIKFFYPFTTTLVELKLNREPLPLTGKNEVCWF
ncbi:MAG: esterase/lipase family protein [Gemmatimonadaceae bacterium]